MKNKAKIALVGAAISVLFLAAAQVNALTVTVNRIPGYFSGNGGEFTITPSGNLCWGNYGELTHNQRGAPLPNFQSFCLETQERVTLGQAYVAGLNTKAIKGGVGPQGDPISIGTAWLYQLFATGTLPGYDYTPGLGRMSSAGDLQKAIWWLEDEQHGAIAPWIATLLQQQFGPNWQAVAKQDNNRQYPVRVLNLGVCGTDVQDFLVMIVPDGGLTLMLLGIGIGGVALISRRLRK